MQKIKDFVCAHLDFRFYSATWITLITAIGTVLCILFLPQEFGYENGLLENIQMAVLLVAFILAIKSKINKKFFYFVALVITIIALREVNCGRTLFFPIPDAPHEYYRWKDLKYGYLAHPIYGLYMTIVGLYFLKNKLFITLWEIIKSIKFPVWNVLLMLAGMVLGMYGEKCMNNMVFEEATEMLFYVALTGIIYLYAYNKNFQLSEKEE